MRISKRYIYGILTVMAMCLCSVSAFAQQDSIPTADADNVPTVASGDETAVVDSMDMPLEFSLSSKDSLRLVKMEKTVKKKRDWTQWRPDPKRAMWLAIVLPGAGQIYNRKYWKLPIFYGGFVGCFYALTWNDQMLSDYSQAYIDIMDNDPATQSYNQFLHLGASITPQNIDRYKNVFKQRKDRYRRWRDLSFFCLLGVYALSIVDAYVDASLSSFDISDDLSLHVEPGFVGSTRKTSTLSPFQTTGVGVNCSLTF